MAPPGGSATVAWVSGNIDDFYRDVDTIALTVVREGEERTLDVTLGERPENP